MAFTPRKGTFAAQVFHVLPVFVASMTCPCSSGCGHPLYSASAKFGSGCGWPAFDKCYSGSVKTIEDNTFGMKRIEILCSNCDGHLGHVFEGEGFTPTNERHCVNSVSIKFVKGQVPENKDEEAVTASL